jgi:plastocyanin
MNKVVIGVAVVVVGGVIGWYFFRNQPNLPGMKIGTENITPAPSNVSDGDVTITDEQIGAAGDQKGGTMGEVVVSYTDSGYQPKEITVKKGTKVTFINESNAGMWTASGQHPTHQLLPGFDQLKSVNKNGTYVYAFEKVGTWKYHNHVSPDQTGIVIVKE